MTSAPRPARCRARRCLAPRCRMLASRRVRRPRARVRYCRCASQRSIYGREAASSRNRSSASRGTGTTSGTWLLSAPSPSVTSDAAASDLVVLVDERIGRAGDRTQLDRDDVVEDAPTVREARGVAADEPERVGLLASAGSPCSAAAGRRGVASGVVLEPGHDARRNPGQQDRDEVGPRLRSASPGSGTRPDTGPGRSPAAPGAGRTAGTAPSRPAGSAFQRSLSPIGTITSLNSGLPRRETWTHGPSAWPRRRSRISARCGGWRPPTRRSPSLLSFGVGRRRAVARQLRLRDLERDRVHAEVVRSR